MGPFCFCIFLLIVLFCYTSCGHSPLRGQNVVGADELVMDSYKIQELMHDGVLQADEKNTTASLRHSGVMVFGEVKKEGVLKVPEGFISLKMALAESGGISYFGDKSFIQIVRGSLSQPKIYSLNWKHIMQLPNDSLLLIPGDIVYVASTPIAGWHRFISQLLSLEPTAKREKILIVSPP